MELSKGDVFFWICAGLIAGIGLQTYEVAFSYVALGSLIVACAAIFIVVASARMRFLVLAIGTLCVIAGWEYAHLVTGGEQEPVPFGQEVIFEGSVISYPRASEYGEGFIMDTSFGHAQVYMPQGFIAEHGDSLVIRGDILQLSETQQYLKKDGVRGVIKNPELIGHSAGGASFVRSLYRLRTAVRETFSKLFGHDEASLATGLLIGGQSVSFSDTLREQMRNSGTTHIVALSGYNVSVIILWAYIVFGTVFGGIFRGIKARARATYWASVGLLALFVFMTGAEASIIRASLMGALLISSQHMGRVYNFRQSVAAVGACMLLLNPLSLRYDLGFVLSFLSLFGIVYIAPLLLHPLKRFRFGATEWAKAFCQTIGAQAAVLPILAVSFGGVSAFSVLVNSIILPFIPAVMGICFGIGCLGLVSLAAAHALSFAVQPILSGVLAVIGLFGSAVPAPLPVSWIVWLAYALALGWGIARLRKLVPHDGLEPFIR